MRAPLTSTLGDADAPTTATGIHRVEFQEDRMTRAMRVVRTIAIAALLTASVALAAQQPEFEVASLKPNSSGSGMIGIRFPSVGQLNVTNMPLREIVRFAFQVQPQQIEGGPDWSTADRFDIVAKAEGKPTMSQIYAMMRTLLADRFALKIRRETRDMPIYELVMARTDRQPGEKLQPATSECRPVSVPAGMPKPPPPPPGAGDGRAALPVHGNAGTARAEARIRPRRRRNAGHRQRRTSGAGLDVGRPLRAAA